MIESICKHCALAVHETIIDDDVKFQSQSGCKLDRIEIFKRRGIEVVPCVDPNDGDEFYVVKGLCNAIRSQKWKERYIDKDLVEQVRKELSIKYQYILLDKGNDKDIKNRIIELSQQKIKPVRVTVIRPYTSQTNSMMIGALLTKNFRLWSVENTNIDISDYDGIDLALTQYKYPFYIYSDSLTEIKPHAIDRIDEIINHELYQFGILKVDNLTVVPMSVHEYFQGNKFGKTLEEKIWNEAKDKLLVLQ